MNKLTKTKKVLKGEEYKGVIKKEVIEISNQNRKGETKGKGILFNRTYFGVLQFLYNNNDKFIKQKDLVPSQIKKSTWTSTYKFGLRKTLLRLKILNKEKTKSGRDQNLHFYTFEREKLKEYILREFYQFWKKEYEDKYNRRIKTKDYLYLEKLNFDANSQILKNYFQKKTNKEFFPNFSKKGNQLELPKTNKGKIAFNNLNIELDKYMTKKEFNKDHHRVDVATEKYILNNKEVEVLDCNLVKIPKENTFKYIFTCIIEKSVERYYRGDLSLDSINKAIISNKLNTDKEIRGGIKPTILS